MSKPIFKLRDGLITATCWKNEHDGKPFYSVDLTRSYQTEDGEWKETNSFTGGDILRAGNLATSAYNRTLELRAEDAA